MTLPATISSSFVTKVLSRTTPDGDSCIVYTGWRSKDGYGMVDLPGGNTKIAAHRFAYETQVGPIPPGSVVHHVCHNRACINIEHLQVVDAITHAKSHGYEGHAERWGYTPGSPCRNCGSNNFGPGPRGVRRCRSCRNDRERHSK